MKLSKSDFQAYVHKIPQIKFEGQQLSSYSGLIIFQKFFDNINLQKKIACCFKHLSGKSVVGFKKVLLIIITNFLLGFRRISDSKKYKTDSLVLRFLGLKKMPSSTTISRTLSRCDDKGYSQYKSLSKKLVLERLSLMSLHRITCDFDGSVLSTTRSAEGTAVGYNKKKKGARSYYPLFATIAQILRTRICCANGRLGKCLTFIIDRETFMIPMELMILLRNLLNH